MLFGLTNYTQISLQFHKPLSSAFSHSGLQNSPHAGHLDVIPQLSQATSYHLIRPFSKICPLNLLDISQISSLSSTPLPPSLRPRRLDHLLTGLPIPTAVLPERSCHFLLKIPPGFPHNLGNRAKLLLPGIWVLARPFLASHIRKTELLEDCLSLSLQFCLLSSTWNALPSPSPNSFIKFPLFIHYSDSLFLHNKLPLSQN